MEAITTTPAAAVSLAMFSPDKFRDPSSRRALRFSTSAKKDRNSSSGNGNGDTDLKLVPILRNHTLSEDAAMGVVLSAANVRGWTTGSGWIRPSDLDSGMERVSTFPWSLFTKSPQRRMRVAFTCNVCGQRTTRAINPHAYTDGTVFVQCCGCNVFHKLVDNLNLFHEMKCYVDPSFNPNVNDGMSVKFFDEDEDKGADIFPGI
ncbi:hypothetical protein SASPL_154887 [Salvia splendens]|uniref:DNL-type domain-containing protein n=1 Tax=Salvia splendens TaxID=180675 RepID=A0A8X8W0X6_SALSN|nr:hypothetical protein SASPL_154887 [Salvia splendens]